MIIQENITIAPYTTFKIGGPARFFCLVKSEDDLVQAVTFAKEKKLPILVIGGGSNLLVSDDGFDGLILKIEIMGKKYVDSQDTGSVTIEAGAGEDWEELVAEAVDKGYYGMENLSSIPGKVGASPVQNIGAYGVEASNVIRSVRAFDTNEMKFVELSHDDCKFSYRDSLFKHEKGRYVVTRVAYELKKVGKLNTEYKDLRTYLFKNNIADPSLHEVRNAVVEIRKSKLPDWTKWGTAGSFFKNPVITAEHYSKLKDQYPELPGFPEPDGQIKVSLGWILDKVCDSKGIVMGNVGTYEKQALVLVAKPGAKAAEIVALAQKLMACVQEKTGIKIEAEVEWAVV